MIGIQYKDTFAAKGSALHAALVDGDQKKAKAIYEDTTTRMKALVPQALTVQDLIEIARSTVVTDKHIEELNKRIEAFDNATKEKK